MSGWISPDKLKSQRSAGVWCSGVWVWELAVNVIFLFDLLTLLWLSLVFECAYAQLVLPWYGVPEPCDDQPLHQVLSREFDFVIDRIIERAKDFDLCQAVVGSIRILTQHLHNARQSDRWIFTPLFSVTQNSYWLTCSLLIILCLSSINTTIISLMNKLQ